MGKNIAYQNKDITSKIFADNFKEKSLSVYGLDIPKIVKEWISMTQVGRLFAEEKEEAVREVEMKAAQEKRKRH